MTSNNSSQNQPSIQLSKIDKRNVNGQQGELLSEVTTELSDEEMIVFKEENDNGFEDEYQGNEIRERNETLGNLEIRNRVTLGGNEANDDKNEIPKVKLDFVNEYDEEQSQSNKSNDK